jgi:hypothetical protein
MGRMYQLKLDVNPLIGRIKIVADGDISSAASNVKRYGYYQPR